jgi:hypothetical protein
MPRRRDLYGRLEHVSKRMRSPNGITPEERRRRVREAVNELIEEYESSGELPEAYEEFEDKGEDEDLFEYLYRKIEERKRREGYDA